MDEARGIRNLIDWLKAHPDAWAILEAADNEARATIGIGIGSYYDEGPEFRLTIGDDLNKTFMEVTEAAEIEMARKLAAQAAAALEGVRQQIELKRKELDLKRKELAELEKREAKLKGE